MNGSFLSGKKWRFKDSSAKLKNLNPGPTHAIRARSYRPFINAVLNSKLISSRCICVIPVVTLVIFVGFYACAEWLVVQCGIESLVACRPMKAEELVPLALPNEAHTILEPNLGVAQIEQRYSGRMYWVFLASAYILVCIFILCILWLIAARWLDGWKWASALIFVGLVIGALLAYFDSIPLAGPLFENTIQRKWSGITNFLSIVRLMGGVAHGTTVSVVLVIAAILYGPRVRPGKGRKRKYEDEKTLVEKRNHLTIVLYASTILLVTGILLWNQNYAWASSFIDQKQAADHTRAFFSSVIASLGGFFTILLAAIYVPASFIIFERAKLAIRMRRVPWTDVPEELQKRGLTFSFAESLPRILAIAAPLLTGPVAKLFENAAFK